MRKIKTPLLLVLVVIAVLAVWYLGKTGTPTVDAPPSVETTLPADDLQEITDADSTAVNDLPAEDGSYDGKEDVALYLHVYGRLPSNYITKAQAQSQGWDGGSVEQVAPGKCIGGSVFGNYEGLLPEAPGREYHECDIDTLGADSRGPKRLVYSNDGLIYYTDDHYESFTLLYGDEA